MLNIIEQSHFYYYYFSFLSFYLIYIILLPFILPISIHDTTHDTIIIITS